MPAEAITQGLFTPVPRAPPGDPRHVTMDTIASAGGAPEAGDWADTDGLAVSDEDAASTDSEDHDARLSSRLGGPAATLQQNRVGALTFAPADGARAAQDPRWQPGHRQPAHD